MQARHKAVALWVVDFCSAGLNLPAAQAKTRPASERTRAFFMGLSRDAAAS